MESEIKAFKMNLNFKWTPNVDEIESETDITKAEIRADETAVAYLGLMNKIEDARHDLAEMNRDSDSLRYIFTAAKAKYLELKLSAHKLANADVTAERDTKPEADATEGSGPGVQPDSGQSL